MGRVRRSRTHGSKKNLAKTQKTKRYGRDIDQIHSDLHDPIKLKKLERSELDVDKPGLGQFPCVACAREFISQIALDGHKTTKVHKRRLKELKDEPYSIEESELAAGLGKDNGRSKTKDPKVEMEVVSLEEEELEL